MQIREAFSHGLLFDLHAVSTVAFRELTLPLTRRDMYKSMNLFLILTMLITAICAQSKEKAIIEYLGTTYIMPDGCPTPKCDINDPDCIRTRRYVRQLQKTLINVFFISFLKKSAVRNLYAHCVQGEEGQHLGCITDQLGDGSYLTVPVYATICSAMCYETKANMEKVKKCPYPGFRKRNSILSKLFK